MLVNANWAVEAGCATQRFSEALAAPLSSSAN